jgi:hypothetical protein
VRPELGIIFFWFRSATSGNIEKAEWGAAARFRYNYKPYKCHNIPYITTSRIASNAHHFNTILTKDFENLMAYI